MNLHLFSLNRCLVVFVSSPIILSLFQSPAQASRMLVGSFNWMADSEYYRVNCDDPSLGMISGTAEFKITKDPLILDDVEKSYIKLTQTGGGCIEDVSNFELPYMTEKIPLVGGTILDENWQVKRLQYSGTDVLPDPGGNGGESGFIDLMTGMGMSLTSFPGGGTIPQPKTTFLKITDLEVEHVPESTSSLSFLALGVLGVGSAFLRGKKQKKSTCKKIL